jgi:hypothetical protein
VPDDAGARAEADDATARAPDDAGARAVPDAASDPIPRSRTITVRVRSAPFSAHPEVLVHAPASFVPNGRINLVVFLHGWNGCVGVIGAADNAPCSPGGPVRFAMDVVRSIDRAAVNALLVVPQLAFDAPTSASGRLADRGAFRALVAELLAHPDLTSILGRARGIDEIGRVVVLAHSGAYVPAAFVLSRGGIDVHEVHLLDALYRDEPAFESWVRAHAREFALAGAQHRRFTVIYTDQEGTGARSRTMLARMSDELPIADRARLVREHRLLSPAPADLYGAALFALRTAVIHEDIPRVFLAPLLETAALSP